MANYIIIPNEGKPDLLAYQIKIAIAGINPWSLRLFANNIVPDANTVLADLTEATFTGYGAVSMTRSLWTSPVMVGDYANSTWQAVATEWVCSASGQTIYGAYYTDDDLNVIRGVQRFDTPVVLAPGGVIDVLPNYRFAQLVI